MSNQKQSIDYFDLKVAFKSDHQADLQHTLEQYEELYDYIKMTPKLRKNQLLINSNDIIPFLGYLDISNWNTIDTLRIRSEIRSKLESLLQKSLRPEYRAHYQWCITALESFKWGRFLPSMEEGEM